MHEGGNAERGEGGLPDRAGRGDGLAAREGGGRGGGGVGWAAAGATEAEVPLHPHQVRSLFRSFRPSSVFSILHEVGRARFWHPNCVRSRASTRSLYPSNKEEDTDRVACCLRSRKRHWQWQWRWQWQRQWQSPLGQRLVSGASPSENNARSPCRIIGYLLQPGLPPPSFLTTRHRTLLFFAVPPFLSLRPSLPPPLYIFMLNRCMSTGGRALPPLCPKHSPFSPTSYLHRQFQLSSDPPITIVRSPPPSSSDPRP